MVNLNCQSLPEDFEPCQYLVSFPICPPKCSLKVYREEKRFSLIIGFCQKVLSLAGFRYFILPPNAHLNFCLKPILIKFRSVPFPHHFYFSFPPNAFLRFIG